MASRRKSRSTRTSMIRDLRRSAELSMEFSDELDNLDTLSLAQLRKLHRTHVRKNPYKEDRYYADREIRSAKRSKRGRGKHKASKRGMHAFIGRMNPYGRANEDQIQTRRYTRKQVQERDRAAFIAKGHPAWRRDREVRYDISRSNPPISQAEADVLLAVLRRHGYACNPVRSNPVLMNPGNRYRQQASSWKRMRGQAWKGRGEQRVHYAKRLHRAVSTRYAHSSWKGYGR